MIVQSLWVPGLVPNLNDLLDAKSRGGRGRKGKGAAWNPYNELKAAYCGRVALLARAGGLVPMAHASFTFAVVEANRKRDPDGFCAGAAKFGLDGLVLAGVIKSDGWKHVLGLSFAPWTVGRDVGVRITLEGEAL